MQPWIVQLKPALEALPKIKSAALPLRHDHPRRRLAHERHGRIAFAHPPFPEKRGRVASLPQLVRDGARPRRQRVKIFAHTIPRRRHAREQRRPRHRPHWMRRHRLREIDALRRQCVEARRARVRVARIAARLRPPLRRHDPENVRSLHFAVELAPLPRQLHASFLRLRPDRIFLIFDYAARLLISLRSEQGSSAS